MADDVPTGDRAVFAFLELIALAFAFEGVSALLNGKGWTTWGGAGIATVFFFVSGIKWPFIKQLFKEIMPRALARSATAQLIMASGALFISLTLGTILWRQPFRSFNSKPSAEQARIKLDGVDLIRPHEGGPPFPFFNVSFQSAGKLPVMETTYDYRIHPSVDTLSIAQAEALQDSLQDRARHINSNVTRFAGDGPEYFSIPNQAGPQAEIVRRAVRLVEENKICLYLFIRFQYRDESMGEGVVGVTEACVYFWENFASRECGRQRSFLMQVRR